METLFGIKLLDGVNTLDFVFRFSINLVVIYLIVRQIYFRIHPSRDYLFTMFMFNLIIFFVCYLLNSVKLSLGFAFGIFAIFSILRYRTETVPIKEMTYMFISISIAIINAISSHAVGLIQVLFTNIIVIGFTYILEKSWVKNELKRSIIYEKIDLIKPENHDELMADLRERTGLNIHRFEIGRIDFLKDTVNIKVFYNEDIKGRTNEQKP